MLRNRGDGLEEGRSLGEDWEFNHKAEAVRCCPCRVPFPLFSWGLSFSSKIQSLNLLMPGILEFPGESDFWVFPCIGMYLPAFAQQICTLWSHHLPRHGAKRDPVCFKAFHLVHLVSWHCQLRFQHLLLSTSQPPVSGRHSPSLWIAWVLHQLTLIRYLLCAKVYTCSSPTCPTTLSREYNDSLFPEGNPIIQRLCIIIAIGKRKP